MSNDAGASADTFEPAPSPMVQLLSRPVVAINVGLERFASDLDAQGAAVTQVAWSPPARGNAQLARLLSKLGS